jgi:hypothetical protein
MVAVKESIPETDAGGLLYAKALDRAFMTDFQSRPSHV